MIFVWTGRGWWVPISLTLSICFIVGLGQPFTMSLALAGLSCVGLGLHARFCPARWVRDPKTGCERFKRPYHSAYWIRAEYWGLIYLALAAWLQVPARGAAL